MKTLSDNIIEVNDYDLDGPLDAIKVEDVRKFIKGLKGVFELKAEVIVSGAEVINIIDKLAGDKLI